MNYGDEYSIEIAPGFDPEAATPNELNQQFANAQRLTQFHSSPDLSFTQVGRNKVLERSICFKIDDDRLIEINDSFLRTSVVIGNEVSDLISFQFVSTVKRSEFLGERLNVHDLGPAIIVTAIPGSEMTYRAPKINMRIRHVMVYTTLSNLIQRMGESEQDYPKWLREVLDGSIDRPRQRVLFLEDIHRDLTWPLFNRPVVDALLPRWLAAKFEELLCVGLQILKNSQAFISQAPASKPMPGEDKIRRARNILSREYANPPLLPDLARQLGISETQLKSGFKAMTGTTVRQFCIRKRIDAAKLLLHENHHSISEVADIVGYQDHSAFSRAFQRQSGCSPRKWRQSGGA